MLGQRHDGKKRTSRHPRRFSGRSPGHTRSPVNRTAIWGSVTRNKKGRTTHKAKKRLRKIKKGTLTRSEQYVAIYH